MKVHDLRPAKGSRRPRKRLGRGIAAGQGKTAGYGTKGSRSRSGRGGKPYFEGGQLPLVRRLPHRRGFTNFNRVEYTVVNVEALDRFAAGSVVDEGALEDVGLIGPGERPVKVLGRGELDRPLTVRLPVSKGAKEKIEAAGGSVVEQV